MSDPGVTDVDWPQAWRIIPSRFPPIDTFERIAPKEDSEQLAKLEGLTNPRLREARGDIRITPEERWVSGPGATYVMAPFAHMNPQGSRFSDGSYGIYYAADSLEGAIAETIHHQSESFADARGLGPEERDMRVLVGGLMARLHDPREDFADCHLPDQKDYAAPQELAKALREKDSDGLIYNSVRHEGGENVALFWPDVPEIPVQERHLRYDWDGTRIYRYFEYETEEFVEF